MRLPNRVNYTVMEKRRKTPYDALLETLQYILKQKLSKKARTAIVGSIKDMSGPYSLSGSCLKAFERILDLPTVYVEEISDYFPPELWELFYIKSLK